MTKSPINREVALAGQQVRRKVIFAFALCSVIPLLLLTYAFHAPVREFLGPIVGLKDSVSVPALLAFTALLMAGGAFIGQHGSWNRKPRAGYKVIFVPFADGKPAGKPQDVLTGFLNDKGEAQGRPVGVRLDKQGALLVADDVGDTVWRVTPSAAHAASR